MQICIFDSMGRRICYNNRAPAGTSIRYSISYVDPHVQPHRQEVFTDELPDRATRLDKLAALVAYVQRTAPYNQTFAEWDHIAHSERPWPEDGQPTDRSDR